MRKGGTYVGVWCLAVFIFTIVAEYGLCHAEPMEDIKAAIRDKGVQWRAGDTSVFRLTDSQKRLRLGLKKPTAISTERIMPRSLTAAVPEAALPTSLNWITDGYVTGIKDQGTCGGCWAFAAAAALESYVLITDNIPNTDDDRAEEILLSCSDAGNCDGGYIDDASDYIESSGLPPEVYFPYTQSSTDDKCTNASSGWSDYTRRIISWLYIATTDPSVNAIKIALSTSGPLVSTMNVYYDFYSYESGVYEYVTGSYEGAHAILIVGYTDDSTVNGGGYFVVKNSWGTEWGEEGYFNIAYSQLSSDVAFGEYTIAYTSSETEAIAAPGDLTATALSTTSIKLSWTDNSTTETGFSIERCKGAGCTGFAQIGTVTNGVTTYTDSSLAQSTTYTYRVRAFNSEDNSEYSNNAGATTLAADPVPSAPTNLTAIANSSSSIILSWTDNSTTETGFRVERCQGAGCKNFKEIGALPASSRNTCTAVNSGLKKGTTYNYRVRAYNSSGNSSYSNTASAKTLTVQDPKRPPYPQGRW